MSSTPYPIGTIRQYTASVPREPAELFPDSIKAALDRIEALSNNARDGEARPSADNIEWAKRVLLRVLPRHYLLGAEIDAFQREIHVNWEHGTKRVTVFLPEANQLKIYYECITEQGIDHHLRPRANDPWEVSGVLRWLFE
jgi:hypothetical protein